MVKIKKGEHFQMTSARKNSTQQKEALPATAEGSVPLTPKCDTHPLWSFLHANISRKRNCLEKQNEMH